ncbi:hypothetical protein [uncultured Thiohalocapsa sp.]|uniref:hypothetical protein n=1 Tax=uncultured Thiohalocapsa sp. TaxID=768990 RepID=UPI0025ED6DBC|nr:hypothetical protein [uncultured Thiohalocapsa sp.]
MPARPISTSSLLILTAALAVTPQLAVAADDPAATAGAGPQPAAEAPAPAAQPGDTGAAPAGGDEQSAPDAPTGDAAPAGEETAGAAAGAAAPVGDTEAAPAAEAAPVEPETAPITGAFGIALGEPFAACVVAEVLREEPITYRDADKTEHTGTRYHVMPRVPNTGFTRYAVDTNSDGIVYAVRAYHEPETRSKQCAAARALAAALEAKYGEPIGRGAFGEWYAFRDASVDHYRGIRLYSQRCRRGLYEIVYSDEAAMLAAPAESDDAAETASEDACVAAGL